MSPPGPPATLADPPGPIQHDSEPAGDADPEVVTKASPSDRGVTTTIAGSKGETRAPETKAEPGRTPDQQRQPGRDPDPSSASAVPAAPAGIMASTSDDLLDLSDGTDAATAKAKNVEQPPSLPPPAANTTAATAVHAGTLLDDAIDPMTSSVATLRPTKPLASAVEARPSTPPPPASLLDTPSQGLYVDPTPPTPLASQPPSRTPSNAGRYPPERSSAPPSEVGDDAANEPDDEKRYMSEDEPEGGGEIQSIMRQFTGSGPSADEVMSPRLEIASPMLGTPMQHPPRKSSLEPLAPSIANSIHELQGLRVSASSPSSVRSREKAVAPDDQGPPVPPKDEPGLGLALTPSRSSHTTLEGTQANTESPMSPSMNLHRPPPPEPEPEPALPFDFHRFLEQLRNKKADPVARYLKSFLQEFAKRQWMVHEQVKIISDFLAFIANKMAQCDVWREVSDAEFDNAREGMEKLVMNRLYTQTFSPAIPPPQPIPGAKPKRRGGERPMGPGRKGQHQEDVERDDVLTQKINIYGWVREEHLDIPPVSESGRRFLKLAQQELLKIKSYRAPRDKIICVLNCCKVIFGLLKHAKSDSSADSFMPLLIYVVLQCNPEHLVSNVQYILRFRNQEKLGGEAGYYLSSLLGVIQFVENMDRTTLTISDDEFERNVEAAVSAIAEKHKLDPLPPLPSEKSPSSSLFPPGAGPGEATRRRSMDSNQGEPSTPRRSTSSNEGEDEKAAITGLLRSIQRPLSTIGRIFSEDPSGPSTMPAAGPSSAPRTPAPPERVSPRPSGEQHPGSAGSTRPHKLSAEEAAARQASAEAAEAQRVQRAEHANVVETLAAMFPDLDKDIISDVVYEKEGRVGLAVDACLALST